MMMGLVAARLGRSPASADSVVIAEGHSCTLQAVRGTLKGQGAGLVVRLAHQGIILLWKAPRLRSAGLLYVWDGYGVTRRDCRCSRQTRRQ